MFFWDPNGFRIDDAWPRSRPFWQRRALDSSNLLWPLKVKIPSVEMFVIFWCSKGGWIGYSTPIIAASWLDDIRFFLIGGSRGFITEIVIQDLDDLEVPPFLETSQVPWPNKDGPSPGRWRFFLKDRVVFRPPVGVVLSIKQEVVDDPSYVTLWTLGFKTIQVDR